MKKEFKKLNLGKRTIANLETPDMMKFVGGGATNGNTCVQTGNCPPFTKKCRPSW